MAAVQDGLAFKITCNDHVSFKRELEGYHFIKEYWQNVPRLLSYSENNGKFTLLYEDVRLKKTRPRLLTNLLASNQLILNWHEILKIYRAITLNNSRYSKTNGGTKLFYLDRLGNLNEQLREDYSLSRPCSDIHSVNGKKVKFSIDVIDIVLNEVSKFSSGQCIPSQGDFHERNLFSDGTIIDFEGAGWNLLATDIATFLWHSFFVGNHFGPLYAEWSMIADKGKYLNRERQFSLTNRDVCVKLSPSRYRMIKDYINYYLECLPLDNNDTQQVSVAIVFRLLSMFKVPEMTVDDKKIIYILANYFLQYPLLDALNGLLQHQLRISPSEPKTL